MEAKNRLDRVLSADKKLLSIYFTAGYPRLDNVLSLCKSIEEAGADMVEIGIPYSDPVADGPVIQESGQQALKKGMTLKLLFQQLQDLRKQVSLPLLLMGYLNPVLKFGLDVFCEECQNAEIDGVIIPDLPLEEYERNYARLFAEHNMHFIFLVTPATNPERIRLIDSHSTAFIYAVSAAAVTGSKLEVDDARQRYFASLESLQLKHPVLIGFGISDKTTFGLACQHAKGAIIGSAFVRAVGSSPAPEGAAKDFIRRILS